MRAKKNVPRRLPEEREKTPSSRRRVLQALHDLPVRFLGAHLVRQLVESG